MVDNNNDYSVPLGLIAQVDRDGKPVKFHDLQNGTPVQNGVPVQPAVKHEPVQVEANRQSTNNAANPARRRGWSIASLLCGCFTMPVVEKEPIPGGSWTPANTTAAATNPTGLPILNGTAPRSLSMPTPATDGPPYLNGGSGPPPMLSIPVDPVPAAGGQDLPCQDLYRAPMPIGGYDGGWLLPAKSRSCKVTLVLDLDETLVHSSFKPVNTADFIVPVEVEGTVHRVYVSKRPGVDAFMRQMSGIFEVVVFTASLDKYANPVLDRLDGARTVDHRLFREACVLWDGSLVKDLSRLGRDVRKCIIVDNAPSSYMLHPENSIPITSWFDDPSDDQLALLAPWLARLAEEDDVLPTLRELRSALYDMQSPEATSGTHTPLYSPPPAATAASLFHSPQAGWGQEDGEPAAALAAVQLSPPPLPLPQVQFAAGPAAVASADAAAAGLLSMSGRPAAVPAAGYAYAGAGNGLGGAGAYLPPPPPPPAGLGYGAPHGVGVIGGAGAAPVFGHGAGGAAAGGAAAAGYVGRYATLGDVRPEIVSGPLPAADSGAPLPASSFVRILT